MRDTTDEDELIRQNPDLFPRLTRMINARDAMIAEAMTAKNMRPRGFLDVDKKRNRPHLGRLGESVQTVLCNLTDDPKTVLELTEGLNIKIDAKGKAVAKVGKMGLAKKAGTRGNATLWVRA